MKIIRTSKNSCQDNFSRPQKLEKISYRILSWKVFYRKFRYDGEDWTSLWQVCFTGCLKDWASLWPTRSTECRASRHSIQVTHPVFRNKQSSHQRLSKQTKARLSLVIFDLTIYVLLVPHIVLRTMKKLLKKLIISAWVVTSEEFKYLEMSQFR